MYVYDLVVCMFVLLFVFRLLLGERYITQDLVDSRYAFSALEVSANGCVCTVGCVAVPSFPIPSSFYGGRSVRF